MNGLIALVGAGEYLPVMDEIDRHLLASVTASGRPPNVVCLPTAAGREGEESVGRWLRMGEQHFRAMGAFVHALPVIDAASAENAEYAALIETADLIYFSGGNPVYLCQTMKGSKAWSAVESAWKRGSVYVGCSAGAMILAKHVANLRSVGKGSIDGFGMLGAEYVLPHFNHVGPFEYLAGLPRRRLGEGQFILGVDEDTALIGRVGGDWMVMGVSKVHVLTRKGKQSFGAGEAVHLPGEDG